MKRAKATMAAKRFTKTTEAAEATHTGGEVIPGWFGATAEMRPVQRRLIEGTGGLTAAPEAGLGAETSGGEGGSTAETESVA